MSDLEPTSRAITEVAKAGGKIADTLGKGIDASKEVGEFLSGSSLKAIPRAIVSLLGGDWIIGKQVENILLIQARIHELARENRVQLDADTLPWRIKVEAVRGMADEDDDFLQQKWSTLLVTAMRSDEKRKELDRIILDIFKKLSPLSARLLIFVLQQENDGAKLIRGDLARTFAKQERIPIQNAAMVMDHLTQLRCVQHLPSTKTTHATTITALGREMTERLSG